MLADIHSSLATCLAVAGLLLSAVTLQAAEETDPFAALTAAVNQPAAKYTPPDLSIRVLDASKLHLSPDTLSKTASLLATCVQKNRMFETEKDLPLCSRMIGLALLLSPANPAATNLNQQLVSGKQIGPVEGAPVTRATVAVHLVTTLEKMHQIEVGNATASLKQTQLKTYAPKLEADRQKVISILQALQENKEFLERIMK